MVAISMASLDEETKANLEILKALDEAISQGPWEHNLFFQGIGKKLRDLRDKFQQELGLDAASLETSQKNTVDLAVQHSQLTEVYISLYQAEGANIRKWLGVVTSVIGHSVSRPVFKSEIDIQAAIRAKTYKQNDAYIAVKIREEDIMKSPTGQPILDREGRELLMLREGAVKLANIVRFVHLSGDYIFRDGVLIKQNSNT